jgi:hypothetical protein
MAVKVSPQQRSALWIYQVDPHEIHYLKFILEAYEGLTTLTTLDPQKGLLDVMVVWRFCWKPWVKNWSSSGSVRWDKP